jgi:putative FmdB family regulatory protein
MPTYEYRCERCGRSTEAFQKFSDVPLALCPECGGPLRRLIGAGAGVLVRGAGSARGSGSGSCSLEESGRTCCGRSTRCDSPGCEDRP